MSKPKLNDPKYLDIHDKNVDLEQYIERQETELQKLREVIDLLLWYDSDDKMYFKYPHPDLEKINELINPK